MQALLRVTFTPQQAATIRAGARAEFARSPVTAIGSLHHYFAITRCVQTFDGPTRFRLAMREGEVMRSPVLKGEALGGGKLTMAEEDGIRVYLSILSDLPIPQ